MPHNKGTTRTGIAQVLLLLAAVGLLAVGVQCAPSTPVYQTTVSFLSHPQGGSGVGTLTCTFSAWYSGETPATTPVVKSDWYEKSSGGYALTGTEEVELSVMDSSFTHTTSYTMLPTTQYLEGDFWVKVYWNDSDGFHAESSAVAHCTLP